MSKFSKFPNYSSHLPGPVWITSVNITIAVLAQIVTGSHCNLEEIILNEVCLKKNIFHYAIANDPRLKKSWLIWTIFFELAKKYMFILERLIFTSTVTWLLEPVFPRLKLYKVKKHAKMKKQRKSLFFASKHLAVVFFQHSQMHCMDVFLKQLNIQYTRITQWNSASGVYH